MNKSFTILFPVLLFCTTAPAQSVAGSGAVSGRVWEASFSDGLPEADVFVNNDSMGIHRVLRTTIDGVFSVTGLAPTRGYKLRVTKANFTTWESTDFEIPAGQTLVFDITLSPQESAQMVETPTARLPVDKGQDGIGTTVTDRQMAMLPVPGRRLDSLVLLSPAAELYRLTGTLAFPSRPALNAILTDGVLAGNRFSGADTGMINGVPFEAIQTFQVLSGGASAEFGHTTGGVVNAISRTGSNALHGDLYGYFSNQQMNATDRYALGNKLFRKSGQAGLNVGGPAVRDKLFYFSNVEVLDWRYDGLNRISTPLLTASSGDVIDTSACTAPAAQCKAAIAFLQGQMNQLVPRFQHSLTGLGRIDYRRSDKNALSLSANVTRSSWPEGDQYGAVAPNGGLIGNGISTNETKFGRAEWTALPTGGLSNELRGGFFFDRFSTLASQPLAGLGSVSIFAGGAAVGATRSYPGLIGEQRLQLADNFRFNFLTHQVTIGAEVMKNRYRRDELYALAGAYVYPTLTAFAQDFRGGRRSYTPSHRHSPSRTGPYPPKIGRYTQKTTGSHFDS